MVTVIGSNLLNRAVTWSEEKIFNLKIQPGFVSICTFRYGPFELLSQFPDRFASSCMITHDSPSIDLVSKLRLCSFL